MANYTWPSTASTSTSPSTGTNGAASPTSATLVGGTDGTNLQPLSVDVSGNLKALPLPSGAATSAAQTTGNTSLSSIDTKTPALVTGRVPVDGSGVTQPVSAAALPLPSGAATETTLAAVNTKLAGTIATSAADQTASGSITTQNLNLTSGAATANSTVLVASTVAMGTVGVQVTGTWTGTLIAQGTLDGSNWVTINSGYNFPGGVLANSIASASVGVFHFYGGPYTSIRVTASAAVTGTAVVTVRISQAQLFTSVLGAIPAGSNSIGSLVANQSVNMAQVGGGTVAQGVGSAPTAIRVVQSTATSSTVTSVAGSATTVSLLASQTARAGASFYNESTAILYLKFGATASVTSYTVQVPPSGFYEIPSTRPYTGAIDGIWSAANGNVRITELT
jgi:hypothetical protein